jgi:DNA topoisomerase VI subunit A
MFLSRISADLHLPVLGLVDSDPYGLKILSVYMSGSKNMSYDSASLTTPDIKWIGLRPSDLDKYDLPEQCRLDMTENDVSNILSACDILMLALPTDLQCLKSHFGTLSSRSRQEKNY